MYLTMVEELAVVIAQMPAEILLITKCAMAFTALERPVFIVDDLNVAFQVPATREASLT